MATSPNTKAIGQDIASFLATLTYPGTSTTVYTQTSLETLKDVIDLVANGGICAEVYGDTDSTERRGFGGRVWDSQTWFLLSLCAMDTSAHAQQIYDARDALTYIFNQHATLGGSVSNLFHAQLVEKSGKFFRIQRSGQWLRAHVIQLETRQEYAIVGGIIS